MGEGAFIIFFECQTTSSFDAHTALCARALCRFLCHFFVTEQRNGERKSAKGLNALWIPAVRLCGRASAQHDAKVSIFSFCERDLKKVALTGVARTSLLQRTIVTASLPAIDESSSRAGKQKLLPSQPICGVGYMPRRWRRLAEQKAPTAMKGRRDGGGSQGERLGVFLGYFLSRDKK